MKNYLGIHDKCNIRKNIISTNQNGIEIYSSDPFISENQIRRNYKNGVFTMSNKKFCSPVLYNNEIKSNRLNGIMCTGKDNKTKIINKNIVKCNLKAGIKIEDEAHILIYNNEVRDNNHQGVLIVEKSSAHVEYNTIKENKKANIAYGGEDSCNTAIIRNQILGGKCEGIFVIESANTLILDNTIADNFDGIVCLTSFCEISQNKIEKNKCNGVMLYKGSSPIFSQNNIESNAGIGVVIKDKSIGTFEKNIIKDNNIDFYIEKKHLNPRDIKINNKIGAKIRQNQEMGCILF